MPLTRPMKGRGVVSDTPVYEAGSAAAPGAAPRRTTGGGGGGRTQDPVASYINELAYGGQRLSEEKAILSAALHAQEMGGIRGFEYTTSRGPATYYPVIEKGQAIDAALKRPMEVSGFTVPEIVEALGGEEQALAHMRAAQNVAGSHHKGIEKTARNAVRGVGADLISEEAEKRALALQAMGLDEAALASRFGAPPPPNAPADIGMPDWMPRMNNLSPVQTGMAYGALAAGTGAAGLALANHLIAQGQQQANPVEYAAAMQALNAYA